AEFAGRAVLPAGARHADRAHAAADGAPAGGGGDGLGEAAAGGVAPAARPQQCSPEECNKEAARPLSQSREDREMSSARLIRNRTGLKIGALALPMAVALGLTGCTVGPDFVKPSAPASAYSRSLPGAGGAQSFAYGAAVAGDWYRLFGSAALDQLVRQALAGNPDLAAARHGLAAAQDELRAVSGAELPRIDVAGQIGRGHINGSELYAPVNSLHATGYRYEIGPTLAY